MTFFYFLLVALIAALNAQQMEPDSFETAFYMSPIAMTDMPPAAPGVILSATYPEFRFIEATIFFSDLINLPHFS